MMNQFSKLGASLLVAIGLTLGLAGFSAQAQTRAVTEQATDKPTPGPKPSPTPKPTKPPKPSPTPKPPKPTPTPKPGKCEVCDHMKGKNKDKEIPCDKVDQYLEDHPNSTRGPCNVTPVTNP
ncbi:MAG TPA: hypothetical protein VGM62_10960 [Chthoniobacterales bacterium]|jgi:outer membrane biosynthesis protein TonB